MIRFIDLGDQILEGQREFAWWDTVVDEFEEFNTAQTWETWEDFAEDYLMEEANGTISQSHPLSRYKGLFPKKWP